MKKWIVSLMILLFLGLGINIHAEDQTPLIGASDYALVLTPYVSKQVVESLEFARWTDTFTPDGCVLTSVSNGALICLIYHSCAEDQPMVCALTFNARVGLRLQDVADLVALPFSGESSFLNAEGARIFDFLR